MTACTCFRLRRTARRVSRLYDAELAALDLTVGQYSLLIAVRAGCGVTLTRLADELEMDRSTLSRNLRPLIARGALVTTAGADARAKSVALTAAGAALLAEARPIWRRTQDRVQRLLGEARLETLHRALDDALARLSEPAAAAAPLGSAPAPARPSAPSRSAA